jgi:hypothetical protein
MNEEKSEKVQKPTLKEELRDMPREKIIDFIDKLFDSEEQ